MLSLVGNAGRSTLVRWVVVAALISKAEAKYNH